MKVVLLLASLLFALTAAEDERTTVRPKELLDAILAELLPGKRIAPFPRMSSPVLKNAKVGYESKDVISLDFNIRLEKATERAVVNVWLTAKTGIIKVVSVPLTGIALKDLAQMGFNPVKVKLKELTCGDGSTILVETDDGPIERIVDKQKKALIFERVTGPTLAGAGIDLELVDKLSFEVSPAEIARCLAARKSKKKADPQEEEGIP